MNSPRYQHVEGNESLVRDTSSGAILSIDNKALQAARLRKERILSTEQRLNKLEHSINDIHSLLTKLIEKLP